MRDRGFIAAGENGSNLCWTHCMLQRHPDGRTRAARGATTDGIDHHQNGAAAGCKKAVDIGGSSRFLDTIAGEVGAHGSDENFRVGHESILAGRGGGGRRLCL